MSKFLCTADWHAGAGTEYGRAPYGTGSRLADQQAALDAIVDIAIRENVDAVLFAGDLTHRNNPTPGILRAIQQPLERLTGHIPVVAVSGNSHDVAHTDEPIALELFSKTLHLHRRPGVTTIRTGMHTEARIACLPWAPPSRLAAASDAGGRADIHALMADHLVAVAAGMRRDLPIHGPGYPAILMLHYSVAGGQSASGMDAALFNETVLPLAELQAQGWDAVVCGHLHRYQVLSQDPLVFYPGPPSIVDFGEAGYEHGCVLLDINDQTGLVEHSFIEIPGREFMTLRLTNENDGLNLDWSDTHKAFDFLRYGAVNLEDAVVRVRYEATPEQARAVDQQAIRRALLAAGAHVVKIDPPEIIRTDRGRLDEVLDQVWADASDTRRPTAAGLLPMDAVEAWIIAQGLDDDTASALRIRTAGWLDAAATREPQEAAA